MSDVTQLLNAINRGDPQATSSLWQFVYDELRQMAAKVLAQEKPGQTLQPTALVHEAYLRLVGPANADGFENRRHFFGAAGEAMRRVLVDLARKHQSKKRGGGNIRVDFDSQIVDFQVLDDRFLALDEALGDLERHDSVSATFVKLRYYSGIKHHEAAEIMGMTRREADQLWAIARAWLFKRIQTI